MEFVYEPEPCVVKAGLLNELTDNNIFLYKSDERRTLLTSSRLVVSPFFKDAYHVLGKTRKDFIELKKHLKLVDAKKVVLRFYIKPET